MYGSFEEMKAETCALYLCGDPAILKIFGHTSQDDMETIQYMVYLSFAHAGLRALELYDPKSQKHGVWNYLEFWPGCSSDLRIRTSTYAGTLWHSALAH